MAEATGNDQHSIVATAAQLFVNPAADASGNYHLLATAGAINTGTNQLAPMDDLDGLLRPVGAQVDIGAYEWRPAALAGDYNGDGAVDAADYVVWRKTGGGQAGYDLWRTNFGRTVGAASRAAPHFVGAGSLGSANLLSVPEPSGHPHGAYRVVGPCRQRRIVPRSDHTESLTGVRRGSRVFIWPSTCARSGFGRAGTRHTVLPRAGRSRTETCAQRDSLHLLCYLCYLLFNFRSDFCTQNRKHDSKVQNSSF